MSFTLLRAGTATEARCSCWDNEEAVLRPHLFTGVAGEGMIPPMSTDRFNSNVDRKVKTEATPIRRVEGTGGERCQDWTDEQKLSIIAESCQDGAVISDVARRHGLRPQIPEAKTQGSSQH